MPSGGLLRDPTLLFKGDTHFLKTTAVQAYICLLLLVLSAYYHFVLRGNGKEQSRPKGSKDEDAAQVESIIVYPIKSCHGIILDKVEVSRKGFKYDRRWLVVTKDGLKKLTLREEPKLTFILPSFEQNEAGDQSMQLRISEKAEKRMPEIKVPLEPTDKEKALWQLLPPIDFYGSTAQGRVVEMHANIKQDWKRSPSEWISEFLGYAVYLIQFDEQASKRQPFPIYKPPYDVEKWGDAKRQELHQHTDIEFQDEYPFLVSTRESLDGINLQLDDLMSDTTATGRVDKAYWSVQQLDKEAGIKMQTFRPNIILKSREGQQSFPPFSEDSWETIWIENEEGTLPIHLVARCKRCLLTAVNPETAQKDVNVPLSLLRKSRFRVKKAEGESGRQGPCFGIYGIPEKSGQDYTSISVGDRVRVRWRPLHLDDEVALGTRKV
ncbi:hypothetical protein CBS101457_001802 [Exobasidium rhododendri]|nr:hypothetical protein CBS101457_001802 [Exobasidium rhododendri]